MTMNRAFAAAAFSLTVCAAGVAGCSTYYGSDPHVAYGANTIVTVVDNKLPANCEGTVTGGIGGAIGGRGVIGTTPAYDAALCTRYAPG